MTFVARSPLDRSDDDRREPPPPAPPVDYLTSAFDAELRDQIKGSCRVITRHIQGIVEDVNKITTMPAYKTEAEDALNKAERIIVLAAQGISAAKAEMGKKQLEGISHAS